MSFLRFSIKIRYLGWTHEFFLLLLLQNSFGLLLFLKKYMNLQKIGQNHAKQSDGKKSTDLPKRYFAPPDFLPECVHIYWHQLKKNSGGANNINIHLERKYLTTHPVIYLWKTGDTSRFPILRLIRTF